MHDQCFDLLTSKLLNFFRDFFERPFLDGSQFCFPVLCKNVQDDNPVFVAIGNDGAMSALAPARLGDVLLDEVATQIGIDFSFDDSTCCLNERVVVSFFLSALSAAVLRCNYS